MPCTMDASSSVSIIAAGQLMQCIPASMRMGMTSGLVCMISAMRQGQVCANGIVGVSQGHDVFTNTLIYAALPEFYAILGLVGALMV